MIRASTDRGPGAVIRILEVAGSSHDDHLLGMTTSPDEAARIIGDWLRMVIERSSESPATTGTASPRDGRVTTR